MGVRADLSFNSHWRTRAGKEVLGMCYPGWWWGRGWGFHPWLAPQWWTYGPWGFWPYTAPYWGVPPTMAPEAELSALRAYARWLREQLDAITKRIEELEKASQR